MTSKQETYSDYCIPIFYDNRNGEMILRDTKEFFDGETSLSDEVKIDQLLKIRNEISINRNFLCGHCQRPIYICGRYKPVLGQKRLHFQHYHCEDNGRECVFYEGAHYTNDEIRRMLFNGRQESREHKSLKQIIQNCFIPVVGKEHVFEEPTLHGNDGGWRRPDIYVQMPDKSIVFEIQLTYIFLSVINERNLVHRSNGRFVMWIFKDFGGKDGETLDSERLNKLDIFAANNFNAFVLDEDAQNEINLKGNLYLTVYYRDYYNEYGRMNAKLGKALVSFDELTFDDDRKLIYYYDSQRKFEQCSDELRRQQNLVREEEIKREQEKLRLERVKQELNEEKGRKEEARQVAEVEERNVKRWKAYGLINKLFSSKRLLDDEMQSMIDRTKSDFDFLQQALEHIDNFVYNHRWEKNSFHSAYYQNSIAFLTAVYDEYRTAGNPDVQTCLRHCWENLACIAKYPGGKDYTVDALFSPALSNINLKFFDFIFSPYHRLMPEQRLKIQEWLKQYHQLYITNGSRTSIKDRYRHFYSWMVLLNEKIRKFGTFTLENAHELMRDKYKVIRGIISLYFNCLSGYNDKYKNLFDVVNVFKNNFPEYTELCCNYTNMRIRKWSIYEELSHIATTTPQEHDLDDLMKILFTKSKD